MTDQTKDDEVMTAAAEKEWEFNYQEHLRLGGKSLHFKSIYKLGWRSCLESSPVVMELRDVIRHTLSLGLVAGDLKQRAESALLTEAIATGKEG